MSLSYTSSQNDEINAMMDMGILGSSPSSKYILPNPISIVPKKPHTDPKIIVGIAILVAGFLIILIVKRHQLTEIDKDEEEL